MCRVVELRPQKALDAIIANNQQSPYHLVFPESGKSPRVGEISPSREDLPDSGRSPRLGKIFPSKLVGTQSNINTSQAGEAHSKRSNDASVLPVSCP